MPRITTYTISGPRTAQPVTIRQVNALLRQAAAEAKAPLYEIVEGNDYLTRTLALYQYADVVMENENQPIQEPSEDFHPGDGHHELARAREADGFNFAEGDE